MVALIFFGAGASAPFGLPTMTEMVNKFEKHLKDKNLPERFFYEQIKKKLLEGYAPSQVDIESVFSIISGIASGMNPRKMGPFPYYYIKRFSNEYDFSQQEKDNAKKLNAMLEEFIKTECKFTGTDEELSKIYRESYEPFFNNLFGVSPMRHQKNNILFPIGWKAYTTNYDVIFENFWNDLHPIMDFFDVSDSNMFVFNHNKGVKDQWQTFVKLHGSIDWEKLEDNRTIKTSSTMFTRAKKLGTAMLYPIQQKDLYLNPWISLFDEFKEGLRKCDYWYFVGYGFNDPFIFEIIKEAITSSKRLIIINPNAKELKEKFPKEMHNMIMTLPIKFGGEYFAKDYEDFTQHKRTIEVVVETTSMRVGLDFPTRMKNTRAAKESTNQVYAIDHGDRSLIACDSNNNDQKKMVFKSEISGFNKLVDYFEIETQLSDSVVTHITLRNQDRLIIAYSQSSYKHDTSDERFKDSRKIDISSFYPKSY